MISYLPNREDGFTKVINDFGYKIGVEIGVREGHYSQYLLENSNLELLYSIDTFPYPNMLPETQNKLQKFGKRSHIVIGESPDVANMFENNYFDFIYIDANHTYEAFYKDLIYWWPKLKTRGLFCGDDYTELTNPGEGEYGVVRAINQFAKEQQQALFVTGSKYNTSQELDRIAKSFGKIIELGLKNILDIKFGTTYDDDIKIPNWYMIKQ